MSNSLPLKKHNRLPFSVRLISMYICAYFLGVLKNTCFIVLIGIIIVKPTCIFYIICITNFRFLRNFAIC